MEELTPMMKQYMEVKNQYKDCILFYRLGDFYEMFFDDAIIASRELEITLTGKDCGLKERAPMCGVPHHSVQNYIAKLIGKGYKVAIGEQLEDPATAKGIVKRDVIRVITPGTIIESNILDENRNNYLASIYANGLNYGLAFSDVSTGEFYATEFINLSNFSNVLNELGRFEPAEIVVNSELYGDSTKIEKIKQRLKTYISVRDNEEEIPNIAQNVDLEEKPYAKDATKLLFAYIMETQKIELKHINQVDVYEYSNYMVLDNIARKNLELTETLREKNKKGSLLWVLDKTATSMGGRNLRRWIEKPLMDIDEINDRLEAVKELKENVILRSDVFDTLKNVYDIERLAGKISYGNVNARDMISLKNSLKQLPALKSLISNCDSKLLKNLHEKLDLLEDVTNLIEAAIVDDPPISIKEGGIIKADFDEEVHKLRTASTEGKNWIIELESKEREQTGIRTLKVGYNKVFGYYIEVSKSFINQVPDRFIRKQTLTNGERYITEELKEIENTILGAQDKIVNLEYDLFTKIRENISLQIERLQKSSSVVADLDTLASLAEVADQNSYTMPIIDNTDEINIKDGRHPVVEKLISAGSFVPNDTFLNTREDRINIITGPNMAGKSTYMRQVALITLMAQIGSFVPASFAKIGIVDRIFTRVGASDDLSTGQSTFMVEMNEVSNIVLNASKRSLLILDEIGRGTSTYDGLSIAWSVVEYIAKTDKIGARTLFATHYHELTELESKVAGVKNYCIAVKEKGEDVIFLRKIVRGGADESYGIYVAKLAGIPNVIVNRANQILNELKEGSYAVAQMKESKKGNDIAQVDMFNYKLGEIATELEKIDVNELTPIDALNTLVKMKNKL
ncbi:MAG: DNA mismatch repair protein MutS [Clostridia bacterium]|nr:DNA mismatch repair protein MutS [Clostridia bacterium]